MELTTEIMGVLGILGALLAVFAFLGLFSLVIARSRQESQLTEYLKDRDELTGRRISIRRCRRERLKELGDRFKGSSQGKSQDREIPLTGAGEPDPGSDLEDVSSWVKENPLEAAACVKTVIRPYVEGNLLEDRPKAIS